MQGMVKHYVFVSSAGAYKANPIEPMHVEGDERKASAGHVAVENYLVEVRQEPAVSSSSCLGDVTHNNIHSVPVALLKFVGGWKLALAQRTQGVGKIKGQEWLIHVEMVQRRLLDLERGSGGDMSKGKEP
jgi:hypothetical protein